MGFQVEPASRTLPAAPSPRAAECGPEAPRGECSAEIWVGGARSCQALSGGGTPQHPQQHPLFSPPSHLEAAHRLSLWCTEWVSKASCLIFWVSFPLCLTGSYPTPPLTDLRIIAQSLAWLMMAAEAGGTETGQLAAEGFGD